MARVRITIDEEWLPELADYFRRRLEYREDCDINCCLHQEYGGESLALLLPEVGPCTCDNDTKDLRKLVERLERQADCVR